MCDKEATRELINEVFLPMSEEEWEEYKALQDDTGTGFDAIDRIRAEKRKANTTPLQELPN